MTTRPRALVLAATALLAAAPLSGQIGLATAPTAVTLIATHRSTLAVGLPSWDWSAGGGGQPGGQASEPGALVVTTSWNIDPAQPVGLTLLAVVGAASRIGSAGSPLTASGTTGGPKEMPDGWRVWMPRPAANASIALFHQPIFAGNARERREDDLALAIERDGRFDALPGADTGDLDLVAVTQ